MNFAEYTEKNGIYIFPFSHKDITEAHSHEFLELAYIVDGEAVQVRDGETTRIKKGNYFIIDYGSIHEYQIPKNCEMKLINCLFTPKFIDPSLGKCRSFRELINNYLIRFSSNFSDINPTQTVFYDDNGFIKDRLDLMQRELAEKRAGYRELMRCCLIEIIVHTLRMIANKKPDILYKNYTNYIIDFINTNYHEPITLAEIAKELNFSLSYLSKAFKADTGIGFNEYLQKTRIEKSCHLLCSTDLKIIEISQMVGYADLCFFNRIFKKHLGQTPSEFRKGL